MLLVVVMLERARRPRTGLVIRSYGALLFSVHNVLKELTEEQKKWNALGAKLKRICNPKPASGKLDVPPEIYAQWSRGGAERNQLVKLLASSEGKKAHMRTGSCRLPLYVM